MTARIRDPLQPFSKRPSAEVHDQAEGQIQELKVGQHLPRMDRRNPLNRLYLHHQAPLDEEIGPEGFPHGYPSIFDIHDLLPLYGQAGAGKTCS
jgi:hypothetical protein